MTSRKLTITIDCPDWCEGSPAKHLDDGNISHQATLGKIPVSAGLVGEVDLVTEVEVTLERYDEVIGDEMRHGTVVVRLGGDETYNAEAAQALALLLTDASELLEGRKVTPTLT